MPQKKKHDFLIYNCDGHNTVALLFAQGQHY